MDKSQYKNVYVFVEQRDGVVQNVALELLGKARELADALHEQVVALLLGKGVKDKADELIAAGADVVLSIEADELAQYTTEPYAQAITQVIHERKPSILLIGAPASAATSVRAFRPASARDLPPTAPDSTFRKTATC